MTVVDSSAWVEHFRNGPLAAAFGPYLAGPDVITPTIVVYEVYKILRREAGEDVALQAVARLRSTIIVPLDDHLALEAADASLEHGLAMTDAIVFATARAHEAQLVTGDADLADLPGVVHLRQPG